MQVHKMMQENKKLLKINCNFKLYKVSKYIKTVIFSFYAHCLLNQKLECIKIKLLFKNSDYLIDKYT